MTATPVEEDQTPVPEAYECQNCGRMCDVSTEGDPRSDREILLGIDAQMQEIKSLVGQVAQEAAPLLGQITGHPMFRMMFGKAKPSE